jgi:hypothetical protein
LRMPGEPFEHDGGTRVEKHWAKLSMN